MKLKELTTKIQVKFNQFSKRYSSGHTVPIQKFLKQMLFGILKSGEVQLNSIARALQEPIALKKVTKRLGGHLGKAELWYDVLESNLQTQRCYLLQCKYLILDLSDIQKNYAETMEGLANVYDGSNGDIGLGYWLCNVTGVNERGSLIVPSYSELYSLEEESSSENAKILSAISHVSGVIGNDKIWVDDRGGDRSSIIKPLLDAERQFIIRQVGNRHLYYQGQKRALKQISRQVKLTDKYSVTKIKKSKKVQESYSCGAVRVKLTETGQDLWLVVMKEKKKGYCWLLCNLNVNGKKAAICTAFIGYGHRWKIEEVHRQVKTDYNLEDICLQRYEALKSMNALLWTAVSFLYTRLDNISMDIITHIELGLRNRKKLSDLLRFVYYKLAFAVKKLLALSKLNDYKEETLPEPNQLSFNLLTI